jgi:hypothetical protein
VPRLWTPPLRELTPETSYGFEVIEFAADLGAPLDEWQQFAVIHGGELLPDGRPRFRILLILVARQNGKTHLAKILILWWMFVDLAERTQQDGKPRMILSTSSKVDYAREAWAAARDLAQSSEMLDGEILSVRTTNGESTITTVDGISYKIAAANKNAARSLTISRLVLDELRAQEDWETWASAEPTTGAVPDAQVLCLSNQGDDRSVVLDAHRKSALKFIETGAGDTRMGLLEWSAPDGADPEDVRALAMANPNLNHAEGRNDLDALLGEAKRAKDAGGEQLTKFRIERMCQRVHVLDPAIDPDSWKDCGTDTPVPIDRDRRRVALCVDVSLDGKHATVVGAVWIPNEDGEGGLLRLETVAAWDGQTCLKELRAQLPGLVRRIRPQLLGWFPNGPAAAVAAQLAAPKKGARRTAWPPAGVTVVEIRGDMAATCMGFAELVDAREVQHPNDPMLDMHVAAAQKLWHGEAWVYARKDAGPIDGAYASAGAAHLARSLPPSLPGRLRVVTANDVT